MPKPRVGQQIKEVLHGKKATSNKSANIDFLTVQFKRLKVKIKNLIEALRAQHLSLLRMNETRLLVARRVAALAAESPIVSITGSAPTEEETPVGKTADLTSYMAVHQNLHVRQKMYCDRYLEHVVEYAVEWEKVIVSRVSSSLVKADRLRIELEHYQSKVDVIRNEKTRRIEKGGMIDAKLADKLFRNESKLGHSRQVYESYASDLAKLIEEVTTRSWKDLLPIILKLSQFDSTLASDEHQLLAHLNQVADGLKKIAHRYHLKPETRQKELETLTSKVFATSSSLEHDVPPQVTTPKSDKEAQLNPMNSQKLEGSSSSKLEGSGSSKENDDEVIHGVINSLKMSSSSNTSTPRASQTKNESAIAHPLSILEAANHPRMSTPPKSTSTRNTGSKNHTRQMNGHGHSSSSTGESSPRNPARKGSRSSSRKRGQRKSQDDKSASNPFDGLDRGATSDGRSGPPNYGSYHASSPRTSSSKDGTRHEYGRHIPRSPRTQSRPQTPSRRTEYYEERQNSIPHTPSRRTEYYEDRQNYSPRASPRGDASRYQNSGQYENAMVQHDHTTVQYPPSTASNGADRYSSPLSPRCIPPGHYSERAQHEQKMAKAWYQFY